jgi:hypothetical protein
MNYDLSPFVLEVVARLTEVEARLAALEAAQPEPLVFPVIDLGLVEGTK